MELLVRTSKLSNVSFLCPCSGITSNGYFSYRRKFYRKPNRISSPLRISLRSEQESTTNDQLNENRQAGSEILWGKETNSVEVIGIGSRKDAIIDFCLESPFQSSWSTLRFWTILSKDSAKIQLEQRSLGKDMMSRNVELPATQLSMPRAVILVVSAGYGLDNVAAIEILRSVKTTSGLSVAIILKPFSFEGQRRQNEVREIVNEVRDHTNFSVVVDTDALLKRDVVTLAEALKSANNAVLLAINCIFILMSGRDNIHFDDPTNMKELQVAEIIELLKSFTEANIGYGAGNNMKSSISQAVFDCPFIGSGVKDSNHMAVCILSSASVMDGSDLKAGVHTFRQTTGWKKEVVYSLVHEPNLEPNLFVATVIVLGSSRENAPQRRGFLSGLARRFPFVFSLLGKDRLEPSDPFPSQSLKTPRLSEDTRSLDNEDRPNSLDSNSASPDLFPEELPPLFDDSFVESDTLRGFDSEDQRSEDEILKANEDFVPDVYGQTSKGRYTLEREPLLSWKDEPGLRVSQVGDKDGETMSGIGPAYDNQFLYTLPVGVKFSKLIIDGPQMESTEPLKQRFSVDMEEELPETSNRPSLDSVTDAGLEAVMDIYNATSTVLKGNFTDSSRKQGQLSERAASMLEAERGSRKKWSPVMEMQYRGGIYRGRCQGGLPEGKGRLTLMDGSIYDGMWRYGKRSGLGIFYYSNGDVFQGSWRDDHMHGKGWLYFCSGDRWFANYWKGKPNGEGRFYSKDGEIFFGHFKDGWRHGHSLSITVDGTRWAETWDEGVLLSRKLLGY